MMAAETNAALEWARKVTACLVGLPIPGRMARELREAFEAFEHQVRETRRACAMSADDVRQSGARRGKGR